MKLFWQESLDFVVVEVQRRAFVELDVNGEEPLDRMDSAGAIYEAGEYWNVIYTWESLEIYNAR